MNNINTANGVELGLIWGIQHKYKIHRRLLLGEGEEENLEDRAFGIPNLLNYDKERIDYCGADSL